MAENIKCLLVDIDNVLISEVEEVPSEIGDPDCKLIRPYRFHPNKEMEPWVKASNQTEYMIRSSDIMTGRCRRRCPRGTRCQGPVRPGAVPILS